MTLAFNVISHSAMGKRNSPTLKRNAIESHPPPLENWKFLFNCLARGLKSGGRMSVVKVLFKESLEIRDISQRSEFAARFIYNGVKRRWWFPNSWINFFANLSDQIIFWHSTIFYQLCKFTWLVVSAFFFFFFFFLMKDLQRRTTQSDTSLKVTLFHIFYIFNI